MSARTGKSRDRIDRDRRVYLSLLFILFVLGLFWILLFLWGGLSGPPNVVFGVPTILFALCLVLAVLVVYGEEEQG